MNKNRFQRLGCLLFVVLFMFTSSKTTLFASEVMNDATSLYSDTKARATKLLTENNLNLNIDKCVNLYDDSDEVVAVAYKLSPKGYIIVDKEVNIVEYSLLNDLPFDSDEKVYYFGVCDYYYKTDNNEYINVLSQVIQDSEQMHAKSIEFAEKIENATNLSNTVYKQYDGTDSLAKSAAKTSNTYYTTSYTPRTISYNPDGICGSTAAAILLLYYRDHVDSFVVPSWHDTSDGVSLITLLEPNIDGDEPGSMDYDVADGLNWYFRWRGISSSYSASSTTVSFTKYQAKVTRNRPLILGITQHPTYGEHWVVGYGYSISTSGGNPYYYIVNNGWGSNGIYISSSYTDYIISLNV